MESITPKLNKIIVSGVKICMRLNYSAIRSTEFLVALLMICSSIYSLLNNRIYDFFILFLSRFLQASFLSPIYPFLPTLPIVILFSVSLYFYAMGRQKHLDGIYAISWLIYLPSLLYFSRVDWLQVLGLPINFQMFETKLSFAETLIIGISLVTGRILLFYISQIREIYLEMLGRGAEKNDLEHVLPGMMMFTILLAGSSTAASLAISYLIPVFRHLLNSIITLLPYPYIIIGVICLTIIPLCIIIYFHSGASD